ncbi:hypothetical protein PS2_032213 [Malus domestica]
MHKEAFIPYLAHESVCIRGWVNTPTSTQDIPDKTFTLLLGNGVGSRMTPKEKQVISPAQIPLAALAQNNEEQYKVNHVHHNRGTDE